MEAPPLDVPTNLDQSSGAPRVSNRSAASGPDRAAALLADLDASQRSAVTNASALLAISAPAGSGKTRTLTHRIAYRVATEEIRAQRVLAVTYTRKAAGELRARLGGPLGCGEVTAGTFHSLALAQLRRRSSDRGRSFPGLLDRKARVLASIVGGRGAQATIAINEAASEIEWAKARGLTTEQYREAAVRSSRPLSRPVEEFANFYVRYEQEKRKRQLIDFDDVLWWCADALESDADFAAAQRFRFRHLFVDEFQDVTPTQLRLLRGWMGKRNDLTAVGDDAQSIYGFAGAQPNALAHFSRLFPGAVLVALATNYRSTPQIVTVSDAILRDGSGVHRPTPNAARPPGNAPTVRAFDNEDDEAKAVALEARKAHDRGVAWSQMAILYRTNAQSAPFETALKKLGVPFRLRGATRFADRPEVKVALEHLRSAANDNPHRRLRDLVDDITVSEDSDVTQEQRDHVDAVARLAREYVAIDGDGGSIHGFFAWLDTATRGNDAPSAGAQVIELSTFHAAKGLEWDAVFVTGLEQGLVPISFAKTPPERAEEQRLLHVGLSRAGQELHCSWARQRGGRSRRPSPWLETVEAVIAGTRPSSLRTGLDKRSGLASAKAALRAGASKNSAGIPLTKADAQLLADLKEWRRNVARAHDLPAFTIFNDRTLIAIATDRPMTRSALLDVNGVGPAKLDRHGQAVLDIVNRHGIANNPGSPP